MLDALQNAGVIEKRWKCNSCRVTKPRCDAKQSSFLTPHPNCFINTWGGKKKEHCKDWAKVNMVLKWTLYCFLTSLIASFPCIAFSRSQRGELWCCDAGEQDSNANIFATWCTPGHRSITSNRRDLSAASGGPVVFGLLLKKRSRFNRSNAKLVSLSKTLNPRLHHWQSWIVSRFG